MKKTTAQPSKVDIDQAHDLFSDYLAYCNSVGRLLAAEDYLPIAERKKRWRRKAVAEFKEKVRGVYRTYYTLNLNQT